jgi:hypothetical protein
MDSSDTMQPMRKIAPTRPQKVQALLPVKAFMQVKGPRWSGLTLEALSSAKPIQARVRIMDRVQVAAAGTFGKVADIANAEGELPAGLRCKVKL